MGMHSKWLGGALVFYDDSEPQRWLDAWGPDICKYIEEFVRTPIASADSPAGYTVTLVEAGGGETTLALESGALGGVLLVTADANEDDGANVQAQGEAFLLASGKECYFGAKIKVSEATESDFLVGLCITDTDLLGGLSDGVYFRKVDGSTTMNFVLEKNSTETATAYGSAIVADTWYTLEFYWDGAAMHWYVNGVDQTDPAITNLPDDEYLTPSFQFLNGAAGAGKTLRVDWIRAIQNNE